MIKDITNDSKVKMDKSLQTLSQDLSKLRTGRASTALVDHIKVDYYGNLTPLNHVASVAVSDSRTLTITPWEQSLVRAIEKSIIDADLGLNPIGLGSSIKIALPPLTEERRNELIKLIRQEAENARIAVRNIRRDANNHVKKLLKDKVITEDDERKSENDIQKLTDEYIKKIDEVISHKEKEVMTI
jgi:ribosome recycling factor